MKTQDKSQAGRKSFSANGNSKGTVDASKAKSALKAKVYHDQDADLKWLKKKRIVVIGYGSQGHGQALNLRDAGHSEAVENREACD